jgi:hypothetical protein
VVFYFLLPLPLFLKPLTHILPAQVMKKVLLSLFLLLAASYSVQAQDKLIKFESEEHNFGKIKEEDGSASHVYNFTNTSAFPVKLTYVKASCGCTTPSWTQDIVQPNGTGSVTASYDARNRAGAFDKGVTVKVSKVSKEGKVDSSVAEGVFYLRFKGEVSPRPRGIADWYPTKMGNLRFNSNHLAFNNIKNNEKKSQKMVIYNEQSTAIEIKDVKAPKHVTIQFFDARTGTELKNKMINSKDSIRLEATYDATTVNDWGFLHDKFSLTTTDSLEPEKSIYLSATVEENLPAVDQLTPEQKAKLPKITFETTTFDYGTINQGQEVKTTFKFTNTGGSDLIIRKTKASCGCTAGDPEKKVLKAGESTVINVTFNSTGKSGKDSKTITVISNAPESPSVTLTIKGEIKVPASATPTPGSSNNPTGAPSQIQLAPAH